MGIAPQQATTVEVAAPTLPVTHEVAQENTRKALALILLAILAVEIFAALASVYVASLLHVDVAGMVSPMKDVLSVVFGPTIALVGAATGFYFGSNSGQASQTTTLGEQQ